MEILGVFLRTLTFLGMPAYIQMKELEKFALFVDLKEGTMSVRSKIGAPIILSHGIILLIR
jgi:hypothetical protein